MGRNKHAFNGKCCICGIESELTFEHIPPRCAGNKNGVRVHKLEDILGKDAPIWKRSNIPYKQLQKGYGSHSLCKSCNNDTGTWYGSAYCEVSNLFKNIVMENRIKSGRTIDVALSIRPLNFIKQVLSMFCTSNGRPINGFVRELVLDKELSAESLRNIKISMVVNIGSVHHTSGVAGKMQLNFREGNSGSRVAILSDIMYFPLGFIMYIDPSDGDEIAGLDISKFIQYKFDEEVLIRMRISVVESNSIFPGDFRSRNEIEMGYDEVEENEL